MLGSWLGGLGVAGGGGGVGGGGDHESMREWVLWLKEMKLILLDLCWKMKNEVF